MLLNKFTNAIFGLSKPNNLSIIVEDESPLIAQDYDNLEDSNENKSLDFTHEPYLVFGSPIYQDNTLHMIRIDDPKLFCKNVKIWTGSSKPVTRTDSDGNTKRFTKNRIEDKERSKAIAEAIQNDTISGTSVLSISEVIEDGIPRYLCWDGQHRRGAFKLLQDDIKCYPIIKLHFICHIYKNDTKQGIIKKFTEINKSVPVPQEILNMLELELHRNGMSKKERNYENIKHVADAVSMDLSKIYYEYCKPSNSPILPHFNMHNVNQDIMHYLKEYELYDVTAHELLYKITLLNETLGKKYNSMKLNKQLRNRLEKVNMHTVQCYLFIESDNFTTKLDSDE